VVEKGNNGVLQGHAPKTDALHRGLELLSEYNAMGLRKADEKSELSLYMAEVLKRLPNRQSEALNLLTQEISRVDEIIDKYQGEKEALIQILLEVNALNHWLPKTSLMRISTRLGVPMTRIYHIASFYKAFSLVPQGRHLVQVCLGTACQVRGAPRLLDKVMSNLKLTAAGTDAENKFTVTTVNCLGCCALGPVMMVDDEHYSNPSQEQIKQILASYS
jgi:NADH-quinone oxidoreductase subunit E